MKMKPPPEIESGEIPLPASQMFQNVFWKKSCIGIQAPLCRLPCPVFPSHLPLAPTPCLHSGHQICRLSVNTYFILIITTEDETQHHTYLYLTCTCLLHLISIVHQVLFHLIYPNDLIHLVHLMLPKYSIKPIHSTLGMCPHCWLSLYLSV